MNEREAALEAGLREVLVDLWSDFADAVTFASVSLDPGNERSGWSIRMSGLADRIAEVSRLVGAASWESVSVRLLLDGWWEAVHRSRDLPVPPFDRERAEVVLARSTA